MAKKKKQQRTRWIFEAQAAEGTYIRMGLIHNKSKGNPMDVIRLEILSKSQPEPLAWNMRIDEANALIFGLSKILTYIFYSMGSSGKFLKQYYQRYKGDHEG